MESTVKVKVTIEMDDGEGGSSMHMDRCSGFSLPCGMGLSIALAVEGVAGGLAFEVLSHAIQTLPPESCSVDCSPLIYAATEYLAAVEDWRAKVT